MAGKVLIAWLLLASVCFSQTPVALHTSDPKFAPGWEVVSPPQYPFAFAGRSAGYTNGVRTTGSYEVAYCLVDEFSAVSPPSSPVVINPKTNDWDIVGTTPGVPLWVRAGGIYWVWRPVGTTQWKHFAVDENRQHQWHAMRPFKAICGWQHTYGGHWLYQAGNFSSFLNGFPASRQIVKSPPAPVVRLMECPNSSYDVAYSWACNENETALSPILTVAATTGSPIQHAPFIVIRQLPAGNAQPPQGALGSYVYMRKPGQQWHRQPCLDGHTGYLWAIDLVTIRIPQFVESNIAPGQPGGRSYLSSLHKALRYWGGDIIVDNHVSICCPIISEYSGKAWAYQPQNHWIASYGTTNGAGTWTLTIDGVTTPAMPRTANLDKAWNQWKPVIDATFGMGNVVVSDFWPLYAPKIEAAGKWAAQDMTGRIAVQVKDTAGVVVDSRIVGTQVGRGWVMSQADTKFVRTISTSNGGRFTVTDTGITPDGITGYPMGWPMWLECSQRTSLIGASFIMTQSNCGIATCDNNGGGCFHFHCCKCNVSPFWMNTRPVTFGFRCLGSSAWGNGGHSCSELIMEKCHLQAKFPIVMEGNQTVNWQVRDTTMFSDGTFDSAILTANNANSIQFGGRTTVDNARCLVASVWAKGVFFNELFIDQGMPTLVTSNANSWTKLAIYGGKINQIVNSRERQLAALEYEGYTAEVIDTLDGVSLDSLLNWLHVFESPAGPNEPYIMRLVTDNLDSQHNVAIQAKMITPVMNAVYKPRAADEVPSLLQSLMTSVAP